MPVRYGQETKAKAIRLVREHAGDYPSGYAAISAVAGWLGMTAAAGAAGRPDHGGSGRDLRARRARPARARVGRDSRGRLLFGRLPP